MCNRVLQILLLDPDLGVVVWLTDVLMRAGYPVLPATSLQSARNLLLNCPAKVDLVIVNPRFSSAPAIAEFFADLDLGSPESLLLEDVEVQMESLSCDEIARRILSSVRQVDLGTAAEFPGM